MDPSRPSRSALAAAALTAAAVAAPPVVMTAPAHAVGGSPVVKACVKKKTGAVRLVSSKKKCRPGERFRTWNVSGPTGPTGPTGPAGPAGPAGPSHTYWAKGGTAVVDLTNVPTSLASVVVPAGHYVITANTYLFESAGPGPVQLSFCRLLANGSEADPDVLGGAMFPAAPAGVQPVPLSLTYTASVSTALSLTCNTAFPGQTAKSQFATLSATRVGAVN